MRVLNKFYQGLWWNLVDTYVLGTYGATRFSSSLNSPTNKNFVVELAKENATNFFSEDTLVFVIRKLPINLTEGTLQKLLRFVQQVAMSVKGVAVVLGFTSLIGLRTYFSSLRNYRHFQDTFNSAIKYCYFTSFFKNLTFAVVQVVLQQTQQILRNNAVLQSTKGECSRYVY